MLTPSCQKAYDRWIDTKTWHTGYSPDEHRFYDFVRTCIQSGEDIDGDEIRRDIMMRYEGTMEPSRLEDKAEYYSIVLEAFSRRTGLM